MFRVSLFLNYISKHVLKSSRSDPFIRKTYPCNLYPLKPHFYVCKPGFIRGIPICLIFAPKHRLWVLGEAVLTCVSTIYVLSNNKKKISKLSILTQLRDVTRALPEILPVQKLFILYNFKKLCILQGHVFVICKIVISVISNL